MVMARKGEENKTTKLLKTNKDFLHANTLPVICNYFIKILGSSGTIQGPCAQLNYEALKGENCAPTNFFLR